MGMLPTPTHEKMSTRLQLLKHLEWRVSGVLSLTIPKRVVRSFRQFYLWMSHKRELPSLIKPEWVVRSSGQIPTIIIPYNETVTPCSFGLKIHEWCICAAGPTSPSDIPLWCTRENGRLRLRLKRMFDSLDRFWWRAQWNSGQASHWIKLAKCNVACFGLGLPTKFWRPGNGLESSWFLVLVEVKLQPKHRVALSNAHTGDVVPFWWAHHSRSSYVPLQPGGSKSGFTSSYTHPRLAREGRVHLPEAV